MARSSKGRGDSSALECAILGVLSLIGPCTPYAVRQEFARSPSSQWSGSAGAVYPALRRMGRQGLVTSAAEPGSGRHARLFRLTEAGRAQLKGWLRSPVTLDEASNVFDPVRLRVFFFAALTPRERLDVATDAVRKLEDAVRQAEAYEASLGDDSFQRLASSGARRQMQVRLDWFRECAEWLRRTPAVGRAAAGHARRPATRPHVLSPPRTHFTRGRLR